MEKKNTGLKVLVVILSLFVVALGGYFVYDKMLSEEKNNVELDNNINNGQSSENNDNKEITIDDVGKYISLDDHVFNSKVSTKKVKLNNLDETITSQFYREQDKVINSVHVSDSAVFNAQYELKYFVNNNILSILYTIKESNEIGTCATEMAVINIDLLNSKVVSEEELLSRVGVSYESLVKGQYDKALESWKKLNELNGTEISHYEVTFADFRDNKNKYVNEGIEKISDIIYTYIENGKIKYDYYTINLDSLFYQVGKGGCFNWETVILGDY